MTLTKFIFLDVDGVLNSMPYCERAGRELNPENIRRLKEIVDATGAKIVLSSTWKQIWDDTGKDAKDMRLRLTYALDAYRLFIGAFTPNLPTGFRPEEIKQFLEEYKSVHPMEKVVWVSLDDDYKEEHYRSCGLGSGLIQTRFFCKSEDEGGLQDIHVEKAIQMLGRKHDHHYRNVSGFPKTDL